ncbi:MAG: 1,4-dihydroxy-2-naphthoate octaprenyltransferase [Bacteroidia bacterium]
MKTWISALRLRTLPLATASITMGTLAAGVLGESSRSIFWFALATAISLQILSNLANDYGDFIKGTDNAARLGNQRAMQSGHIAPLQMKMAIALFVGISLVLGVNLLYEASANHWEWVTWLFFIVGLLAIAAALKYTMGKNPYGYSGLGDVFVFLFFGPVAVAGTFILHQQFIWNWSDDWPVILAAVALGLLSTAVLNTNNIRDIANDQASGKITIPVRIGLKNARLYHLTITLTACILMILFTMIVYPVYMLWSALGMVPILLQVKKVMLEEPSPAYNALLKQLSLGILGWVIAYVVVGSFHDLFVISNIIHTYGN